MKTYASPTVVEFGKVSELIQGCGGLGTEGWGFYDSDSRYRWLYSSNGWQCVCTTVASERC